jgi:predicted transcriptional regulator
MDSYRTALAEYLKPDTRKQAELAVALGKSQAAVSRYATGARFPRSTTAKDIDRITGGAVPFELWQAEAAQRFGIAA